MDKKILLRELLLRYKEEITPTKKGAYREGNRINQIASMYIAKRNIFSLRPVDIAEFRNFRMKEGISVSTVKKDLSILSQVFAVCYSEWGIDVVNPVSLVKVRGKLNKRRRRISIAEQSAILKGLSGDIRAFVEFAIETGMRRGEIHNLRVNHVYLNKCYLQVIDDKNGNDRSVPLSPRAIEIIKSLPVKRSLQSRVFSVGHVDNVTKAFKKACVDIGITDMRFHDTRHEATSRFFELCDKDGNYKLSLMEVMSITGHKTVTQIKLYTHLRSDILARKLA